MWQLLVETGSRSEATAAILARFKADEAAVRRDVDELVTQLKALAVLEERQCRAQSGAQKAAQLPRRATAPPELD